MPNEKSNTKIKPITYTPSTPEIMDFIVRSAKTELGDVPLTQVIDAIVKTRMRQAGDRVVK